MKNLYNEYSAGHNELLESTMRAAVSKIWNQLVETDNYCPRQVQLMAMEEVSYYFSHKILMRASKMRKNRREEKK